MTDYWTVIFCGVWAAVVSWVAYTAGYSKCELKHAVRETERSKKELEKQ